MNPVSPRLLAVPLACAITAGVAVAVPAAPTQGTQPRLVVFEAFSSPG